MAVNMSFPKPRKLQNKFFEIARTDNGTVKCVLPKGATVVDIDICQTADAVTGAATFDIGLGATANGLVNDFSMGTTSVGLAKPGNTLGANFGQVLAADSTVTVTFTVGTSTAGGTGWVRIGYLPPLPNEGMFS